MWRSLLELPFFGVAGLLGPPGHLSVTAHRKKVTLWRAWGDRAPIELETVPDRDLAGYQRHLGSPGTVRDGLELRDVKLRSGVLIASCRVPGSDDIVLRGAVELPGPRMLVCRTGLPPGEPEDLLPFFDDLHFMLLTARPAEVATSGHRVVQSVVDLQRGVCFSLPRALFFESDDEQLFKVCRGGRCEAEIAFAAYPDDDGDGGRRFLEDLWTTPAMRGDLPEPFGDGGHVLRAVFSYVGSERLFRCVSVPAGDHRLQICTIGSSSDLPELDRLLEQIAGSVCQVDVFDGETCTAPAQDAPREQPRLFEPWYNRDLD